VLVDKEKTGELGITQRYKYKPGQRNCQKERNPADQPAL
jgi:hypothetical protein